MMAQYNPAIFDVADAEQAKAIILTPEGGRSTEARWQTETPYLMGLIEANLGLNRDSVVLDYGCGIGRMAKALIERFGCRVVGADISLGMLALAAEYVASDRFIPCGPEVLDDAMLAGVEFDAALAIWVLQHCFDLSADVARIKRALKPGGRLFVVNDRRRLVPTHELGWVDDGLNIRLMLGQQMRFVGDGELDPVQIGVVSQVSFWATFSKGDKSNGHL